MSTIITIKLPPQTKRSPMVVAIQKRHGHGQAPMKDRRADRGGARNRQRDFRDERY